MALTGAFLDTSVLLGGLIDFGESSRPAQRLMGALADGRLADCRTAWHCCLEFYSVATRLPAEYRLVPRDALHLLEEEVLGRLGVRDLPAATRLSMLREAAEDRVAGGRIYDAHIAETARASGVGVVVTDNRRHFTALVKHGIAVVTAAEFVTRLTPHSR